MRGCDSRSAERHVRVFQMGCLELERSRRTRERQAVVKRMADIDGRLREIDKMIREYQEALAIPAGAGAEQAGAGRRSAAGGARGRRTFRY